MSDQRAVAALYRQLLSSWDNRNAHEFAALFAEDGHIVGFDGSSHNGPSDIESHLAPIFVHHKTPAYVSKVRSIRFLHADVAVLSAVAGMIPDGQSDLNPALNAVQTLLAVKRDGQWRVALFQNTPAVFHGRPELVEEMTEELRQARAPT